MPIDMKGYKVIHENRVYKCLQVEPLWGCDGVKEGELDRPERLRVSIIDHDGYFAAIEDYAKCFAFLKDVQVSKVSKNA